jgi:hypothetical protein
MHRLESNELVECADLIRALLLNAAVRERLHSTPMPWLSSIHSPVSRDAKCRCPTLRRRVAGAGQEDTITAGEHTPDS